MECGPSLRIAEYRVNPQGLTSVDNVIGVTRHWVGAKDAAHPAHACMTCSFRDSIAPHISPQTCPQDAGGGGSQLHRRTAAVRLTCAAASGTRSRGPLEPSAPKPAAPPSEGDPTPAAAAAGRRFRSPGWAGRRLRSHLLQSLGRAGRRFWSHLLRSLVRAGWRFRSRRKRCSRPGR